MSLVYCTHMCASLHQNIHLNSTVLFLLNKSYEGAVFRMLLSLIAQSGARNTAVSFTSTFSILLKDPLNKCMSCARILHQKSGPKQPDVSMETSLSKSIHRSLMQVAIMNSSWGPSWLCCVVTPSGNACKQPEQTVSHNMYTNNVCWTYNTGMLCCKFVINIKGVAASAKAGQWFPWLPLWPYRAMFWKVWRFCLNSWTGRVFVKVPAHLQCLDRLASFTFKTMELGSKNSF